MPNRLELFGNAPVFGNMLTCAEPFDVVACGDGCAESVGRPSVTHFDAFMDAVRQCNAADELLGGDFVMDPPDPDYGYHCTPANALTFSGMGVDGVHTAILLVDGAITDDSPIVYICPMDSPYVCVIAESFLSYLADGCDASPETMAALLESGGQPLIDFIRSNFDGVRLLAEDRTDALDRVHGNAVHHRET